MDGILEMIRREALNFPKISRVMLFGSRARGDNTDSSDYDIAVFGADDETAALFADRLDGLPTLHGIDLIFIKERHIGTPIYESIMKEGCVIMDKFAAKLDNYEKAVLRLGESLAEAEGSESTTLRDGVIQRFEFTCELAWKTAREYLISQGETDINSPKPVMRAAYRTGLINNEKGWIALLDDRNITSHIYDEAQAEDVYRRICTVHKQLFDALLIKLKG